jgi:3-phosphoshikimate 1-carboxyvinyltransferase
VVHPAARRLAGETRVPGDKSIGHRALLFAALAHGPSEVRGLGGGEDNARTRRALASLGVEIADRGPGELLIAGVGLDGLAAPGAPIDCGNSGTTMRLLCGVLAAQRFVSVLDGDESLRRRPMRRVAEPLAAMGAVVSGQPGARPGEIYPPLRLSPAPGGLRGIDHAQAVASAQVKSAILLAGLYAEGETRVREPGRSRDHTERMLAYLGAPVASAGEGVIALDPAGWDRRLVARPLEVPGDPSAAAFLVAAALVAGAERVVVESVCVNVTRTGFLDVLAAMGAEVGIERRAGDGEPTANLVLAAGCGDDLRATEIAGDLTVRSIDELPVLAVVAAQARGDTVVREAGELRVKESDRIATTCAMLRALGVEVEERADGMTIRGTAGAPFRAATIDAAGDHRIAMSAAVAGLHAAGPVRVTDVANVATSFPSFVDTLRALGARVETS